MKGLISLTLLSQIVLIALVSCSDKQGQEDSPIAKGKTTSLVDAAQSRGSTLTLEEDIKPVIVRTGTFNIIFFEMDLGIKLTPWRQIGSRGKVESGIRLGLGTVPKRNSGEDQDFANLFLFGNKDFGERAYYQLQEGQLTSLVQFIEVLEKVQFNTAPEEITYRMIYANWGDMRFQVSPDLGIEILVFTDEQNGEVWSPLNSEHFKQALNLAIDRSEKLLAMQKTATF